MALKYISLDDTTRKRMLDEFNFDLECDSCYLSKRFNDNGKKCFVNIMPTHVLKGNDETLAQELKELDCFLTHEERNTANGVILAKVPVTASTTFAEGEFNRFYIRALCLRALEEGRSLVVYRAKDSAKPRPDSEGLINTSVDPAKLLQDLRENKGIDTALGLPAGPNSGLSIKLN